MGVTAFGFLQAKPGEPKPLYAIFGDEAYLMRLARESVRTAVLGPDADSMAETVFPGDSARPVQVFDEARTLPFLAPRRLVVVENAEDFVSKYRKELETYAEHPARTGSIVLLVKSWPSNTRLAKIVEEKGLAIDCRAPREAEIPSFLANLAQARYKLKLPNDAGRLLLDLVGPEVGVLAAEIDKLATYVGKAPTITADDVAKMVDSGRVQEIWKALDALTVGKLPEALAILDKLLEANEPPIKILAGISISLLKVHHAGMLRVRKVSAPEAAREAGIQGFLVEKMVQQHSHLGPSRTAKLPHLLLQADLDLKGYSQLPPRAILERLFVTLGRPRAD